MLIAVRGFGSIWTRPVAKGPRNRWHFGASDAAYYNTTGVLVADRLRNRLCVFGVARFNGNSGFRPDHTHRMMQKVFKCEPLCVCSGHNRVLFMTMLSSPEKPDTYLVTITAKQYGGINRDLAGHWLHSDAYLISFSEYRGQQEVMLVMPAYTWVEGRLGTFFGEPVAQKPWCARLVLSAIV